MRAMLAILALSLGVLLPAPATAPSAPSQAGTAITSPCPADQVDVALSGWVEQPDGTAVFYNPVTHRPHVGWLRQGAACYYLDPDTLRPHTGWLEADGSRYLFGDGSLAAEGVLVSDCWVTLGGERYHLSASGAADVGWVEVDGDLRCFAADGRLMRGWVRAEDGGLRWADDEGRPVTDGMHEVDGVWQAFGEDGSWLGQPVALPPDDAAHMATLTGSQRAVIDACASVPWPGRNLCAGWVSAVFSRAGVPAPGGDACDIAHAWCTSDDLASLEPGMVIAVASHPHTEAGSQYGHVGIYVGEGIVCDSARTGLRRVGLASWIAWYGATEPVRWGWANGVDLSAS